MQKIEGLLATTGRWVVISQWHYEYADYDASGFFNNILTSSPWKEEWPITFPDGTLVFEGMFAAFRYSSE